MSVSPVETSIPDESEDLLLTALGPLSRGEDLDWPLVKAAMRSATAAVRQTVALNPRSAKAEQVQLRRAYWFLAAHIEGEYDRTQEFLLGRLATLIDLIATAAPVISEAALESVLDQRTENGRTRLRFLQNIASGPKRPTDMAQYVTWQADSEDQGRSAASKHLKRLMLAGYLHRERKGREVYYGLTKSGHEEVEKHRLRPLPVRGVQRFQEERKPEPKLRLLRNNADIPPTYPIAS